MPTCSTNSLPRGCSIPHITHITELNASDKLRDMAKDGLDGVPYTADMTESQTHYLKEWRTFRKMKQADLAAAIYTSIYSYRPNGCGGSHPLWKRSRVIYWT